ncbi:MAG: hypothetical protein C4527_03765 [Candidatus Omnitrophota bacterium]|nr:MAG: hypothetical protein C4527_03765 [Candidatus Omnitrophota bacterium]
MDMIVLNVGSLGVGVGTEVGTDIAVGATIGAGVEIESGIAVGVAITELILSACSFADSPQAKRTSMQLSDSDNL